MKKQVQKNRFIFVLITFFLLNITNQLFAQCEGNRYTEKVFDRTFVQKTADIPYGTNINFSGEQQDLALDFYDILGDTATLRPLIIWAFGGAFVFGYKESPDIVELCYQYGERGYVNASIDYRIFPIAQGIPNEEQLSKVAIEAISDMKASIRFFYKNWEMYGVDTTQIFIGGVSAGAITAVHTAYVDEGDVLPADIQALVDEMGGLEGNSGNPGYSTEVKGVISIAGAILDLDWLDAGEVPIVSIQGDADEIVPYTTGLANGITQMSGGFDLHQRAEELGIPNKLYTIVGGGHTSPVFEGLLNVTIIDTLTAGALNSFVAPQLNCNFPVAIDEPIDPSMNGEILVFPNPSRGNFSLDWSSFSQQKAGKTVIRLFDNTGKMLRLETVDSQQKTVNFESKNWGKGLYHLQVTMNEATFYKKVVLF